MPTTTTGSKAAGAGTGDGDGAAHDRYQDHPEGRADRG